MLFHKGVLNQVGKVSEHNGSVSLRNQKTINLRDHCPTQGLGRAVVAVYHGHSFGEKVTTAVSQLTHLFKEGI